MVSTMKPLTRQEGREVVIREGLEKEQIASRLLAVPGVEEAVVLLNQGVALLKIDPSRIDNVALAELIIDDTEPQQS
jgi:hypothetical protein